MSNSRIYIIANVRFDRKRHTIEDAINVNEVRKGLNRLFPYAMVFSPFDVYVNEGLTGKQRKERCMELLESCDTVYVCKNYKKSGWAEAEYGHAKHLGKTMIMQRNIQVKNI